MDKLKLHSQGRREYLEQLDNQFKNELEAIKKNTELSDVEKKDGIKQLKSKYTKLRDQSGFSLF